MKRIMTILMLLLLPLLLLPWGWENNFTFHLILNLKWNWVRKENFIFLTCEEKIFFSFNFFAFSSTLCSPCTFFKRLLTSSIRIGTHACKLNFWFYFSFLKGNFFFLNDEWIAENWAMRLKIDGWWWRKWMRRWDR